MVQNPISVKTRVEKEVLDEILDGLNSGKMSLEVAREAARETLATIGKIEVHEDSILDFYKRLSEKYADFKILYIKAKGEILAAREQTAYKEALGALDAGNLAGAKQIADSAMQATAHEANQIK